LFSNKLHLLIAWWTGIVKLSSGWMRVTKVITLEENHQFFQILRKFDGCGCFGLDIYGRDESVARIFGFFFVFLRTVEEHKCPAAGMKKRDSQSLTFKY
jgi:hypothetical protein